MTRLPASAISVAATRPARPAPTTITCASSAMSSFPALADQSSPWLLPRSTANGLFEWQRNVNFVPVRDLQGENVQRAGNTQPEFVLRDALHLDKIAISQHGWQSSCITRNHNQVRQV